MSDPYLIAHVVRGSPAFDIAICCDDMGTESDPGPWWIIPTSGHRAYPYWYGNLYATDIPYPIPMAPEGWPDHYSTSAAPKGRGILTGLAEALGLVPKLTPIRRR